MTSSNDPRFDNQEEELLEEDRPERLELEEGDGKAILIAALITFVPVVLLFLGALYFIIWLIFLR